MNIPQINYVIAVAELRHFGRAADRCFISQSTLSAMIGRFEEEIGIRIFDRKTKPVSVTREGETIVERLKAVVRELEQLGEVVQHLKGTLSGTLTIGVIPTVAPYLLPRFLNSFSRQFPKIAFQVSELTTSALKARIIRRELDVGIAAIPLEEPDLVELPLYEEAFWLYDCYRSERPKKLSIESLQIERFWLLEEGHCLRTQVKRICDMDKVDRQQDINFEFKAGSIDSLIRFVQANHGMTLLPHLATLDFTEDEKKKLTPFSDPVPVRSIGLVAHKHFVKKQILEALQAKIRENIVPILGSTDGRGHVFSPL